MRDSRSGNGLGPNRVRDHAARIAAPESRTPSRRPRAPALARLLAILLASATTTILVALASGAIWATVAAWTSIRDML